jgi:branched-subunit amino acid aminotransferase/4-amino-4-deoxychorismate lyase
VTQTVHLPVVALRETCRVAGGRVPLWRWHRERLGAGGVAESVLAAVDQLVAARASEWAGAPTHRARLTVVVAPDGGVTVEVTQQLSSLDVPSGPTVARVDIAAAPPLPVPAAKPADRSWWDVAHKRATDAGTRQAIIVAPDGTIVDGSTSAVWISHHGTLFTPPSPPAIPSVSVAFVRSQARDAGLDVRVEPLIWERFLAAEEAFLTNAFGGAAQVRGRGGAGFSAVAKLFADAWR